MTNKQQIEKLKDNAELAQAAYGYFHLSNPDYKPDGLWSNDKKKLDEFIKDNKRIPTTTDILNVEHNSLFDGDFAPLQAKRFFERYDLLIHQPNTDSGFSATLFGEKESLESNSTSNINSNHITNNKDTATKYINYIFAIRGTEPSNMGDIDADTNLAFKNLPKKQYLDMLLFYYQCIGKIPFYVELDSMPKDKNSQDYKLWQKLYKRSKDSKYKPYIKESLLKDSTKPPLIESGLESNMEFSLKNIDSNTESNFTPPINSKTKLTITGHSLGGCLTQLFALSFARYDTGDRGIIHEVYTYNSPGARKLKPTHQENIPLFCVKAYENLIANYNFHKDKNESIDIGIPTHHVEASHNEKANKYYIGSLISLLGEDIAGLYVMVNNKKFWTSHFITHLTRYLYLFDYLLSPINQNSQWDWNLDNINRFINVIYSSNKEACKHFKDDNQRSKKERETFKKWKKTPLLSILSDMIFITRDSLFQCEIFAKGFYENKQVKDMLQEEYAVDRFFLFEKHNIELKIFSFYRDISLLDRALMQDKPSIFYSLYAFKPYEVYKDNKPYITTQNINLIFSYKSDFAKCFFNENSMPSIDLMQGIESAYARHFTLLWNNPDKLQEQSNFINLHSYSTKASYILVRE